MATLVGTWKLESNENLDEFLKEMGITIILNFYKQKTEFILFIKRNKFCFEKLG